MAHGAKWLACLCTYLFFAITLSAGCGRSDLDIGPIPDGGLPDVGPDATACNATSCPDGCCSNGVCQAGTLDTACGTAGATCVACGTDHCNAQTRTCTTVPSCNAATCPQGCCDQASNCQPGTQTTVCGQEGKSCQDCTTEGFVACLMQACATPVQNCNASSCPTGCCEGSLCVDGSEDTTCGTGGQTCQDCQTSGDVCSASKQCVAPSCGPDTCNGCCFGNQCIAGTAENACGVGGQQCMNCGPEGACQGGACIMSNGCGPENCPGCCQGNACMVGGPQGECGQGGQQCFFCPPQTFCEGSFCMTILPDAGACGPETCGGCCDQNGNCQPGDLTNACGFGGNACAFCPPNFSCPQGFCELPTDGGFCGPQNCAGCCDANNNCQAGDTSMACGLGGQMCDVCPPTASCTTGTCQAATCGPANCTGCCDGNNVCEPGFLDTDCGSEGATCIDCTQTGSTCDDAVSPRACENMQTQCPAPYNGCPAGTTLTPPVAESVCSSTELSNAAEACSGGATSATCTMFFSFEQTSNPACYTCLLPFDVRFQAFTGIFECVAPFAGSACDQAMGCAEDCSNTSCEQCLSGDVQNCKNGVLEGQCMSYFDNAECAVTALEGQASFCDPEEYGGNFGDWLQGVGQFYCGQ
jgi:hypothetical protein